MNKPLISILICTYNAAETIAATINSCLNQNYQNTEILIHDDQSTDNTIKIIKELNNNTITIVNSWQKLWPYWWLNFLLDYAQWEYIAIQDHDDLRHPEKLQKQINFLQSKKWKTYIWCGTKTLMRYESDQQGFEYFLWTENYYTIHPSLIFRNQWQKYPTKSIYMNDALFQKKILCKWKKNIYNINETLTFHRIKNGANNFSYKWFQYSRTTLHTIFQLHPIWYGVCVIGWEIIRKIFYPILYLIKKWKWIDMIERGPFRIMGNKIENYSTSRIWKMKIT